VTDSFLSLDLKVTSALTTVSFRNPVMVKVRGVHFLDWRPVGASILSGEATWAQVDLTGLRYVLVGERY
jgi:hypothetical protein